MGSSPKIPAQYVPPPPPTPTAGDAAEGAERLTEDQRRKRNSTASSFLAGETGSPKTGTTAPAAPTAGFLT